MNKPIQPEQQCPSCHLQSIGPICIGQKRRINKNEKDEYFKAIDCQLWIERRIVEDPAGEERCPTCGQVILQSIQQQVDDALNLIIDNVKLTSMPIIESAVVLDWGDSILSQQGVPATQEHENVRAKQALDALTTDAEPPPVRHRRRGFDDLPKAKKRKKDAPA